MKKKIIFIIVITMFTLLGTTLASNAGSFTELNDACVDDTDGDIAICYYGSFVKAYNREGELIFSKSVYTEGGGGIYVEYIDSYLYVYLGRPGKLLVYDENYNYLTKTENENIYASRSLHEFDYWQNWEKKNGNKYYVLDGIEYCYEKSSFWKNIIKKGECTLFIQNSDGEQILIYESNSE